MPRITLAIAAVLMLAATLPAASAQAPSIRTFVSITGLDTNPCSITEPCRHFSAAVAATSVGGEVDALEPGAYGSFTISQAVTIEGQGWSYVAPPAGGAGITINAGSGNVVIHGVSINGVGATGTTNGIVSNSGGSLTVTDCKFDNFTNDGILIQPGSNISLVATISNTNVANNGHDGIQITGNVFVIISNAYAMNNVNDGVDISENDPFDYAGISNTIAAYNGNNGFEFLQNTNASMSNARADENDRHGIYVSTPGENGQIIKNSEGSNNLDGDLVVNSGGVTLTNNNAFGLVLINSAGGATGVADGTNYIAVVDGTLGSQGLH
jgi:Right handed beta helix region